MHVPWSSVVVTLVDAAVVCCVSVSEGGENGVSNDSLGSWSVRKNERLLGSCELSSD